ncbi:hypothetical protein [[Mycoplasma] testudinis]|uniref:hypothetical protein n=1 Tax=[Mycoplasma] testudinis TaxID=33924 RepID=UPI0004815C39|nr:hypothetical protein [[Mycoplasma] testudinis]
MTRKKPLNPLYPKNKNDYDTLIKEYQFKIKALKFKLSIYDRPERKMPEEVLKFWQKEIQRFEKYIQRMIDERNSKLNKTTQQNFNKQFKKSAS